MVNLMKMPPLDELPNRKRDANSFEERLNSRNLGVYEVESKFLFSDTIKLIRKDAPDYAKGKTLDLGSIQQPDGIFAEKMDAIIAYLEPHLKKGEVEKYVLEVVSKDSAADTTKAATA